MPLFLAPTVISTVPTDIVVVVLNLRWHRRTFVALVAQFHLHANRGVGAGLVIAVNVAVTVAVPVTLQGTESDPAHDPPHEP